MQRMKMRRALFAGVLMVALGLSAPAMAATFTLNTNGGTGSVIVLPNGADLFGSDGGSGHNILTTYTTTALSDQTFNIQWTYNTSDLDPSFDPAGLYYNGSLLQLSDDAGANTQTGSIGFSVFTGDVYGLYVDTVDDLFGAADLAVNVNETPLPAALPLLGSGLGLFGFVVRRRKRKTAAV